MVQPAPATPPPSPPARPGDLLAELTQRYGTDDPFTLMESETDNRHPENALKVYELSSPEVQRSPRGMILRMRALQAADRTGYENFLLSQNIDDAEFNLAKAFYFVSSGQPDKGRLFYEKAMKVPGRFMNSVALEQRRMLCRAEVAMAAYAAAPSGTTKKEAMDSWYEIKLRLQDKPTHKLYQRADAEIRNLSD